MDNEQQFLESGLANINGETMPLLEAKIPALDRGFLFGDAVYEVIRIYQGKPWLMEQHVKRLASSLREIRIDSVDLSRLQQRVHRTIAQGSFGEALVYIQITRGVALRQHSFPESATPLEFFYVQPFADPYTELRSTGAAVITYPDLRWQRCDIKSTNLLGNVLARQAAKEAGGVEALLYRPDDTLTEGTHTSAFAVAGEVLLIPPMGTARLPGITLQFLLGLAEKAGIHTKEQTLKKSDLPQVDEMFLTGTTTEVLPIVKVDDQIIGSGDPGPITRQLQGVYRESVEAFLQDGSNSH